MSRFIVSEGSRTAWGGRTVRIDVAPVPVPMLTRQAHLLRDAHLSGGMDQIPYAAWTSADEAELVGHAILASEAA